MMPSPFDLALPARISFGAGSSDALPGVVSGIAGEGARALVVTGSSPERVRPLLEALAGSLEHLEVCPVSGEPTIEDARRAAQAGLAGGVAAVVAIGGGSVIDLAKAAAMLLGNGGDPMDYIEVIGAGKKITRPSLPVIAVPTTSGTGSEVTANAVLASAEHGVKASLRHPSMIPRHAIVDPALTLGCPPAVTAASGMDALTQCLEPFVSNKANPMTDAWAQAGLVAAGRGLRQAFLDGSDLSARTDMALCSLLSGLALANAKLGAVHGFAGVIGGISPAPHGAICAALLAPVCRANLERARAEGNQRLIDRFGLISGWLSGEEAASPEAGLAWIEETRELLEIPRLSAFGLTEADAEAVVDKSARASSMQGNPVVLAAAELREVFLAAL